MLQEMKIGQTSIYGLFARSLSIKSFKAGTKNVIGLHSYYSNMASGSVTIPTWRRARILLNYEQCLHLSE